MREARRRRKVKGSNPPGLDAARPSKDTGKCAPSCEQRTYAQVAKSAPETRYDNAIYNQMRRVARTFAAELRKLIVDIRGEFLPRKEEKKPLKFVKGKTMHSKPVKQVKKAEPLAPLVFPARTGFDFDYKAHELKEQSRVEWRKLSNRLATLNRTATTERGASTVYDVEAASKLITLYIHDFGCDAFMSFKHELELVCGYSNSRTILDRIQAHPTMNQIVRDAGANCDRFYIDTK